MLIQLTVTKRNNSTLASVLQLFDTATMAEVQSEGTGTGFYHNGAKYHVTETFNAVASAQAVTPKGIKQTIQGVFDCAVVANRTIAVHNLLDTSGNVLTLPIGAIVTSAFYIVDTTFTSATDAATISFGFAVDAVAGLKAATAISTGTTYDALSPIHTVGMIPVGTGATALTPLTAERAVDVTVAVEALTAGKLSVFIEYMVKV